MMLSGLISHLHRVRGAPRGAIKKIKLDAMDHATNKKMLREVAPHHTLITLINVLIISITQINVMMRRASCLNGNPDSSG